MALTTCSNINLLRSAIYAALGIDHYSASTRSRKLRKVCHYANGLDLRRKADVVCLAQHLNLLPEPTMPMLDELPETQHPTTLMDWQLDMLDWAIELGDHKLFKENLLLHAKISEADHIHLIGQAINAKISA